MRANDVAALPRWIAHALCALVIAASAPIVPALAADPVLASYRAVYTITLASTRPMAPIAALTGEISYELHVSSCRPSTTAFHITAQVTSTSGNSGQSDTTMTTEESADGSTFAFTVKKVNNLTDGKPDADYSGKATTDAAHTTIEITAPQPRAITFAKPLLFPLAYTKKLLAAALAGAPTFAAVTYDDPDPVDTASRAQASIGAPAINSSGDPSGNPPSPALKGLRHWPVRIGYSTLDAPDGAPADRTAAMDFYENGINAGMTIDYGDFAITGTLSSLTLLPADTCS